MKEEVARVLSIVFGREIKATDDFSMIRNPEWDSMKQIEIVVSLEEAFGVSIPFDAIGKMTSINAIAEKLGELKGNG